MSLLPSIQTEMEIPAVLPVMTLPDVVLFPQAILPLNIVDPRHRRMLREVLDGNRLLVVAPVDPVSAGARQDSSVRIATVGMVRGAHDNPDGSASVILQGVCRVRLEPTLAERSCFEARVAPVPSAEPFSLLAVAQLREEITELLVGEPELAGDTPEEFLQFLLTLEDPVAFIDLTAYTICESLTVKQRLLESPGLEARYRLLLDYLEGRRALGRFFRSLQGRLSNERILLN